MFFYLFLLISNQHENKLIFPFKYQKFKRSDLKKTRLRNKPRDISKKKRITKFLNLFEAFPIVFKHLGCELKMLFEIYI